VPSFFAVLDDAAKGLARANGGPKLPEGLLGHVWMARGVVGMAEELIATVLRHLAEFFVDVDDVALEIGFRDDARQIDDVAAHFQLGVFGGEGGQLGAQFDFLTVRTFAIGAGLVQAGAILPVFAGPGLAAVAGGGEGGNGGFHSFAVCCCSLWLMVVLVVGVCFFGEGGRQVHGALGVQDQQQAILQFVYAQNELARHAP
jgi:hypothetical protein